MADSIGLWAVSDAQLVRVDRREVDREQRLENWIESDPDILGERLLIIGRQVRTRYGGVIDLLALDSEGRAVVIELKRGRTPRDIVAQALDYVSWVAELSDAELRDMTARSADAPFLEAFGARFRSANAPEQLNTDQRILIVATDVDDSTARIVDHLTARYSVDINVVLLSYFVIAESEVLARTWVVDPVELEDRLDSGGAQQLTSNADRIWTGLWHVNVGIHDDSRRNRNWDDIRRYGFLSAGAGPKWRDEISRLSVGDRVYAYVNGAGYCGGGTVTSAAARADSFIPPGATMALKDLPVESSGWFAESDDPEMAEYMVGVKWLKTLPLSQGLRVAHPLRGTVKKIWSPDLAETLQSAFG